MKRPHMLDAIDEIPDALEAQPEGFNAGFAVALAPEKTAQHGDLADHLADRGRRLRDWLLGQNISALPFFAGEERSRRQFWVRSSPAHQTCQLPRNDHVDRQGKFNLAGVTELQGLDPAAVLEHVEEGLDLPSAAISIDQFNDGFKGLGLAVRQQPPLDRLDPFWRIDFLGDEAGHRHSVALLIGQTDLPCKNLLAHRARRLSMPRRHHEFNLVQHRTGQHFGPKLATVRKAAIVLRADQPVGRGAQSVGALHEFKDIGFAIGHIDEPGFGYRQRGFGDSLIAFRPAPAFANAWALPVGALGLPCPHPGIGDAHRFLRRGHGIGRMQIHAPLGFVGERAEPGNVLAVEVQFGGVLQAQDHRMLPHPRFGLGDVRGQDVLPAQAAFVAIGLVKEPIERLRLGPVRTRAGDAGRRFVGKTCRQFDQSFVQSRISQLRTGKFFPRPRRHRYSQVEITTREQWVYQFRREGSEICRHGYNVNLCHASYV